jgi:hypothetical protein
MNEYVYVMEKPQVSIGFDVLFHHVCYTNIFIRKTQARQCYKPVKILPKVIIRNNNTAKIFESFYQLWVFQNKKVCFDYVTTSGFSLLRRGMLS